MPGIRRTHHAPNVHRCHPCDPIPCQRADPHRSRQRPVRPAACQSHGIHPHRCTATWCRSSLTLVLSGLRQARGHGCPRAVRSPRPRSGPCVSAACSR